MKFCNLEDYLNFGEDSLKDIEFENKIQEYNAYFSNKVKNKLPDEFLKEYYLYDGFHDWKLISIKIDYFNGDNKLSASFFNDFKSIKKTIVYHSIKTFESNFSYEHFKDVENNDFGIDEFDIINDDCFSHEVYFPSGATYKVHFSNIEII